MGMGLVLDTHDKHGSWLWWGGKAICNIHSLGQMEGVSKQAIERRADPGEEVCLPRPEFYASRDTDGFWRRLRLRPIEMSLVPGTRSA